RAAGESQCGFFAPYGAYDDETGALIQAAGASFELYSDRVVLGAGGSGTQEGLDQSRAAALHAYALTVARGVTIPTVFWSEAASDAIASATSGAGAPAALLLASAKGAAAVATDEEAHILIVRLDMEDPWLQRPDAREAVEQLVAAAASGGAGRPATISAFVRAHPPSAPAYGFPPDSEVGSLDYWMGSPNQMSLWNALRLARVAAGGDAALTRPPVRSLLFAAETATWYSLFSQPQPSGALDQRLDQFRALIASIYAASGVAPPPNIAPVHLPSPAPSPATGASSTPKPLTTPP
ncbi:MAG TPA: hypothetical protein VEJ20_07835, partial [Candidatus Eremiobacteraceae bacterium]|nr:hypothetical protein [Candidatus Eremiobacteraceae bacterium]